MYQGRERQSFIWNFALLLSTRQIFLKLIPVNIQILIYIEHVLYKVFRFHYYFLINIQFLQWTNFTYMEVLSIKTVLALEEWHDIVCLLICFYRYDVGKTQHRYLFISCIMLTRIWWETIIGLFCHTHPTPSPTLYKEHPKHQTKTNKQNKQNNTKQVNTGTCNQI